MNALSFRHGLRLTLRQMSRYAVAGLIVGVVGMGTVLVLSGPIGLPIQAAIAVSYPPIVALHFSLQRWFVFAGRQVYQLSGGAQLRRYLLINLTQYVGIAASTQILHGGLGLQAQVAYVLSVGAVTLTAFLLMRSRVFH